MTMAPGFIISPLTISGFPIAATRISALLVLAERSLVPEWHTVGVVDKSSSNKLTGFPTIALRPTIAASLPFSSTPIDLISSTAAIAVHGTSLVFP